MALAALGCSPTKTWTDASHSGGAGTGNLGYSPDGGMYVCFRANGAVAQYEPVFLDRTDSDGYLNGTPKGSTASKRGVPIAIPQVALADNEFGWGLVYGTGRVRTDGGVSQGEGFGLSSTDEELDTASAGDETVAGLVATTDDSANDGPVFAMFPSVSTDSS